MKILLLNVSYEPLRLLSLDEAICKVYSNEVFIEGEDLFSVAGGINRNGNRSNIVLSHVIRNKTYDKSSNAPVPFDRRLLFLIDSYSCSYCNRSGKNANLTHDHIIPKAVLNHKDLRGKVPASKRHLLNKSFINGWGNATTSCKKCNNKKGASLNGVFDKFNQENAESKRTPNMADVIYLKSTQDQRDIFGDFVKPFLKVSKSAAQYSC